MADSLSRPFNTLARAFEESNPGIEVVQIPSGSVLAARKLTEGKDRADVLAVADYLVIDKLLRPDHADWYICFATNEIGIAYTDASKGAARLTSDNWFHVLSGEGVKVAAANPYHDPCGYWTELCWQLADKFYPADVGGGKIVKTMTAKCGKPDSRRSDAQQLLQLVESAGGIDYAFVYRSQVLQHNLPFVRLPPQISLGDINHLDFYRQAEIELPGKTKGSTFKKKGEAIVFAVTIPKHAKHGDLAARYIEFMLSTEGRALLSTEYMTLADKPWTRDFENVPVSLRMNLTDRSRSPTTTTAAGVPM
jgi:molybdate/tungstate transport system substrate-binding protein